MEDLSGDTEAGRLMAERLASGQPLALVCHGPAALLTTVGADGTSPFAGYRLTSLTNAEERLNGLADKAKWLLEDRLRDLGVDYRVGEPFSPHVEVDRNLLTGQNPASAVPLAHEVLKALAAADGDGATNVALVRRVYDSKGDPAVLAASASEDFVWDVTPGFPDGGVYHGIEGVGDFFSRLMSHAGSWYAEAEEYHPSGEDRVFVVGHYRGTNHGTTTPVRFIHEWTVSGGKLARMYQAADSAVAQQVVNG